MTIASLDLTPQQLKGYKKTSREAQTAAFMCFLVYFTVKRTSFNYMQVPIRLSLVCTLMIFYFWNNYMWGRHDLLVVFVILLIVNAYFMLTTGKNPGYYQKPISSQQRSLLLTHYTSQSQLDHSKPTKSHQGCVPSTQQQSQSLNPLQQHISDSIPTFPSAQPSLSPQLLQLFCKLCQCMKRNRMKHCYGCGRCVMKFDHHCPWIGSCVGELNHGKFVLSLLAHTVQASFTLFICLQSLDLYTYYDQTTQTFSTQYGVLILWSIFMSLYILFAGGLFLFHSYLIAANTTTRELVSRRRCHYLKNAQGNPFDQGVINNVIYAMRPDQSGREWIVMKKPEKMERKWYKKIFKNQYYECC